MTFVKTKIALHGLKTGDILDVRILKEEPLDNVPKSVSGEGHKVLAVELIGGEVYHILIEKV